VTNPVKRIVILAAACGLGLLAAAQGPAPENPAPTPSSKEPEAEGQLWDPVLFLMTDAGPAPPGLWAFEDTSPTSEQRSAEKTHSRCLEASLYAAQGDFDKAFRALKEAKAAQPANPEIALAIAQTHLKARDFEAAISAAKALVEKNPDSIEARLTLAEAHFDLRRGKDGAAHRQQAVEHYEAARSLEPQNLEALQPLGQLYLEELQERSADPQARSQTAQKIVDVYGRILEVSWGRYRLIPLLVLASTHQIEGRLAEAEDYYKQAIEIEPRNIHTYVQLADMYDRSNRTDEAIEIYRRALIADPENGRVQLQLDAVLARQSPDKLLEFYQRLAKEFSGSLEIRKLYAIRLARCQKFREAARAYREIAQMDEADAESRLALGLILLKLDRFSEALPALREVEAQHGQTPAILLQLASLYERGAMSQESERLLTQAFEAAGAAEKPQCLYSLVGFYVDHKRYEEALAALDKALGEMGEERRYDIQLERAGVLQALKRCEEAEKIYQELIQANPKASEAYLNLGMLYDKTDQLERAERTYRQVVEFDPNNPDVYNNLGYMWAVRGIRLDEARRMIEKALELAPNASHILDSMGWALYQLGDYNGAADRLEAAIKGLEGGPGDAEVYEHLAEAYRKLNRNKEAMEAYRKALGADPEREGLAAKISSLEAESPDSKPLSSKPAVPPKERPKPAK